MIRTVNALAETWREWMIASSWQLALLGLIVAALVALLRNKSPRLRHGLWLLVLFKVFLPPGLTLPTGIGSWGIPRIVAPVTQRVNSLNGIADAAANESRNLSPPANTPSEDIAPSLSISTIAMAFWAGGAILFWMFVGVRYHELVHLARRDTWIGWLQVIAQGLFWFHPLLWWASRELRHPREEACDDSVLRQGHVGPDQYGETMVRVLTSAKARSMADAGFLGVFERGTKLQIRLEQIMSYQPNQRQFGLSSKTAIVALAAILLPMSTSLPGKLDAQETTTTSASSQATSATAKPKAQKSTYPRIMRTIPVVGATEIKTSVDEIRAIFDQDMSGGMSWTGGGPDFPAIDKSQKARWVNKRTCVLPVKLERGKYYRVGINSKSFQNFKSASGVPTPPSAIYFATVGASPDVVARARRPEITRLIPANGAKDVDPNIPWIKVTFNMPMGGGMSWTGGGENFPALPDGKKPVWSKDGLSCAFPVKLKSDHKYTMGLNSRSHNNFQSAAGVPLVPVVYEFETK